MRTARDAVGPDVELMVDAGGSEQFWPHGYKWALETAKMLADYDVVWFEEALPPDDLEGFIELRRARAGADRDRRGADAAAELPPVDRAAGRGHHPAGLHQVRRADGGAADRLDGVRAQHPVGAARLEHGGRPGGRPAPGGGDAGGPLRRVPDAVAVHRGDRRRRRSALDAEGMLPIPTAPGLGLDLDWDGITRFSRGAAPDPSRILLAVLRSCGSCGIRVKVARPARDARGAVLHASRYHRLRISDSASCASSAPRALRVETRLPPPSGQIGALFIGHVSARCLDILHRQGSRLPSRRTTASCPRQPAKPHEVDASTRLSTSSSPAQAPSSALTTKCT